MRTSFSQSISLSLQEYHMIDKVRTNTELLEEISFLSQRVKVLERSESDLRLSVKVIKARQRLHEFSYNHNVKELLRKTLDELEEITGSQIGFFHFLSADERTIDLQAWSTNTLEKKCNAQSAQKHYSVDQAGVWVDCIHQRQAVIHNDYVSLQHRKGLPPGHAPVIRVLLVPIILHGRIMAILGVGNKPADYSSTDMEIVSTLAHLIWDICERKQAEDRLRASEAKYRTLVENLPQKIFTKDRNFIYVSCNNNFASDLGITPDEFEGKTDYVFFPKKLADKYRTDDHRIMTSGVTEIIEEQYKNKDGEIFWVQTIKTPLRDDMGNITGILGVFIDITESKQAEDSLREQKSRYRSLIDAIGQSNIGLFLVDAGYRVRYMNQPVVTAFGDQTGCICFEGVGKANSPCGYCKLDEVIQQHKTLHYQPTTADGKTYDIVAVPFQDTDGTLCKLEIIQDITARRLADAALQESEARLREAQRLSRLGSWELNLQTNRLIWSDENYRIFGIDPSEFDASYEAFLAIVHPDDREMVDTAYTESVKCRKPYAVDHRLLMKDGRIKYVHERCETEYDNQGNPVRSFGTTQNITERMQAEAALTLSELRHRRFYESGLLGVIYWNMRGQITDANDKFLEMVGYTRDDLATGRIDWVNMTPPEFRYMDDRSVIELKETGVNKMPFEKEYIRKDGTRLPIILAGAMLDDERENGVAFVMDISERRRLEKQFHQAQKMQSVGRLAGGVAHDYNNALNAIIGFTELAMEKIGPAEPTHADLSEVLNAAKHATDITRQLLAFARQQVVAPVVLDLNDNIETMLKMFRRLIGEDIDLAWLPGTSLWPVKMDPSQIDQILANLCVNARDAIAGVGKVTIETENNVIDAAYCADHIGFITGEFVLMAVSDNGCGMDKEILDNIFEPFFSTKDVGKGTGLGLATVYGIVKQNNGFINVDSEPGKGTTFKIYLPRHVGEAAKIQGKSTVEIPSGLGETILVVEDDLSVLKFAHKILDELGYSVLIASAPSEALGLAEEHAGKIHLLITDVIMPEMNGRDLANSLQSLCPELKCVFMSGYTRDVIARHGVLDEGIGFLQKPFSKRDLANAVRQVLDEGKNFNA